MIRIIKTKKELRRFVKKNRKQIININGFKFGEKYPIIETTNKSATFYDVKTQENQILTAPFNVTIKEDVL
jgi:protein-disulfide isomerase-like protein with CxxC motif